MSTAARLAKVEGTLSPKAATLAWLAEAHQFPTLPAYVAWLRHQPIEAAPFYRVPDQAERAIRAALRGQPRDLVEAAAHQAVRDAVFLVELVVVLNVEAQETIRAARARCAASVYAARAIIAETGIVNEPTRRHARSGPWRRWRAAVLNLLSSLELLEAGRRLLESRYLDGQGALYQDLAQEWRATVKTVGQLSRHVNPCLVQHNDRDRDVRVLVSTPGDASPGRLAEAYAGSTVTAARAVALDLLGDADGSALLSQRRPAVQES